MDYRKLELNLSFSFSLASYKYVNSYFLYWNFDEKGCFVVSFHEWNDWKNPQFNFSNSFFQSKPRYDTYFSIEFGKKYLTSSEDVSIRPNQITLKVFRLQQKGSGAGGYIKYVLIPSYFVEIMLLRYFMIFTYKVAHIEVG